MTAAPVGRTLPRVVSLDVFRGLTMLVMIFVNDLAGVKGLPWWNYHMPGAANGMTYVDMVFPAFLFILGMSMPLAIEQRFLKRQSSWRVALHVIGRSAGLIVLGLALANVEKGDPRLMGIGRDLWGSLFLIGAILFWEVYPMSPRFTRLFRVLKWSGFALMAALFLIFRRTTSDGQVRWLDKSYWEILGLIGWTYLAVAILYIPTRRWRWAAFAWFVALSAFNVLGAAKWISFDHLPFYFWPYGNGAFAMLAMAGIVTSQIVIEAADRSFRARAISASLFGVTLLIAGAVSYPLGISKIRATPAWCFYSAGVSVFLFLLLFSICDVRGRQRWARFTHAPGANTLLTYLLPDLFYFAIGTAWIPIALRFGWPGAIRSLVFTTLILAISTLLTNRKVRLHL